MIRPHVHVPYEKIADHLSLIRENRLNLEIYLTGRTLDIVTPDSFRQLRETLDYGPFFSFHAPFMDLSPGAVDSKVRSATIERFTQVLDIAETLKPKTIVFHSGYEKWKYALKLEPWLEGSLETWRPLRERASDQGIIIAIENVFEDEPSTLRALMENMDSPDFGICFDTGHCNLFSRVPVEEWISTLKPYIRELHLHDNDKSGDQHLPIGEGTFDFSLVFRELRDSDCVYTLEAHTPARVLRSLDAFQEIIDTSPGS